MKYFYTTIFIVVVVMLGCFPMISLAESVKASGISTHSNGRYQITSYATKLRTGRFEFPGVVYGGNTYNVVLTTRGDADANGWQYYSDAELEEHAKWSYDHGIWEFLAQSNNTWTHNPGCGNTHTFTRTLIQEPRNGVCSAARNTCSVGTSTAQSETDSRYTWSCAGLHGGTTAQCSLDKGGRNGNGGNNNGRDTVTTIDPEFNPSCISSDSRALIGGEDSIIFSAVDKNGHSPAGYIFNWLKTSVLAKADLSGGGAAAATLQSSEALVFNQGDVSFTVSAPGMQTKTKQCPGGEFMDFKFGFVKPIVDEAAGESCRLYWDEFEADTTCKVFSQQGQQVGETVLTGETFREVPANNTYQLKCETMGTDADGLVAVVGEFETPYVSCIRKGNLSEI